MTEAGREAVLDALDSYGTSPLSFLIRYGADWRVFATDRGHLCYLEARRAAVAWSDPLCEAVELPGLVGRARHQVLPLL